MVRSDPDLVQGNIQIKPNALSYLLACCGFIEYVKFAYVQHQVYFLHSGQNDEDIFELRSSKWCGGSALYQKYNQILWKLGQHGSFEMFRHR